MRALRDRPTALERWTSGVRPGMKLATVADGPRRRRVLPEAGAQGRARLPRVRRDHLPLRADRRGDLPDRDRGAGVVRAHGDADLPPLAGTAQRRGPPRRAAPRPRPAAGHVVHRRGAGRRRRARAARGARAARATRRPRATGASTSSCGSSRAGSSSTSGTRRSASAASWPGATTASPWTGGRRSAGERIFIDFNQNCRDRTIASAYSLRPIAGRTGLHAADLGRAGRGHRPARVQPVHRPRAAGGHGRRVGDASTTRRTPSSRCSRSTTSCPAARCRSRRTTRRCPASRRGCSRSKKVEEHWDADGNWIGPS